MWTLKGFDLSCAGRCSIWVSLTERFRHVARSAPYTIQTAARFLSAPTSLVSTHSPGFSMPVSLRRTPISTL